MWRSLLFFVPALLIFCCSFNGKGLEPQNLSVDNSLAYQFDGVDPPTLAVTPQEYPGKTIDEVFSIQFERSFADGANKHLDKNIVISSVGDFQLKTKGYTPFLLTLNQKEIFRFHPKFHEQYWSSLAGTAALLGPDSKQIYVAAIGPGGVCCTNYWIIDVSHNKPRPIFDSETYGRFRDAMEIFDADNDGIYELVQFDSCFRYFMDECGTCTPEPRVVFRYDSRYKKYLPASGLAQDFVKEAMARTESEIKDKYEAWKNGQDDNLKFDLHGSVLDHAVQLMHFGREKEGWRFLKAYDPLYDRKLREEMLWRLKDCPVLNTLPKID